MKMLPTLALPLALLVGVSTFVHAQDADDKPARPVRTPRLTQPWSKMSSLTPEQKIKIGEIHKKMLADAKALKEKETADIMALLSDEQKAEVEKITDDGVAARKRKPADATPTTQPDDAGM